MFNSLDPDRLNSLVSCKSVEMVSALFEKNGIRLTAESAERIYDFIDGKCDQEHNDWFDLFLQFCDS